MPSSQLRMLRYMKGPEARGNGPGNTPSKTSHSQPLPKAHHAPPSSAPIATRQPLVELAKDQTLAAARYPVAQTQAPTSIPTAAHVAPRQHASQPPRSRANSDHGQNHAASEGEQHMWEDSTVQSMFAESLPGSMRHRGIPAPAHYDHNPYSPPRSRRHERVASTRAPELSAPFVVTDNGLLRVLPAGTQAAAAPAVTSGHHHRGMSAEALALGDPYVDDHHYESSKSQPHYPKFHNKIPLRDVRSSDAKLLRRESSHRLSQHFSPAPDTNGTGLSPERFGDISTRLEETIKTGHGLRGLDHKRSTIFQNVDTPIVTPTPPEEDEEPSESSPGNEAPEQRTPRQFRQPISSAPLIHAPIIQAPIPPKKALQESSLPRRSSHQEKKVSRKRRYSLDYDDSALNAMSYEALKAEAFDHDPARETIRQAAEPPCGDSMEEKLVHYKDKDENTQHHFFTQMSVREWDECGDWFLEQFGGIVNKMKDKRREKREIVGRFEDEIAAREEAVRSKVSSIDATLVDLKKEGEGMIHGRETDL